MARASGPASESRTAGSGSKRGPVRYAVVGLGHIAQVAVLPAFAHARENSTLRAVVSGDARKRDEIGRRYRVAHRASYDEYDALLRSGEVDAVYIALPNHLHRDFAVRAAEAGVHVLCEKPMALDEDECRAMLDAARTHDVKLMVAYRLHFDAATLRTLESVRKGAIGEPRLFSSVFTMQVRDHNVRLEAAMGGGPLYDLGIYCINAARAVFDDEPVEAVGWLSRGDDARFDEVEEAFAAMLRFPGERVASFVCSFGGSDVSSYRVVGTRGDIRVEPAYEYAEGLRTTTTIGGRSRTRRFRKTDQFAPELLHFSRCVLEDRTPEPSGLEGLIDVHVIRALYDSAERGAAVPLAPFPSEPAADPRLEMRKPPVRKPPLVRARSASR